MQTALTSPFKTDAQGVDRAEFKDLNKARQALYDRGFPVPDRHGWQTATHMATITFAHRRWCVAVWRKGQP